MKSSYFTCISLSLSKDVLEVFQALRGKFQQIHTLTQRQKDHLKKIYRGNYMANGNIKVCTIVIWNLLIIPALLKGTQGLN